MRKKASIARVVSVVRDANIVRTGTESRAELEFTDSTLARMGANSIFSFDAAARAISCNQGTVLFSKPPNSGRVEVRAGAITAAITGSTGFISNRNVRAGTRGARDGERATMIGMLEGKLNGCANWRNAQGREQTYCFKLGPGEMIVAQPGRQPVVVQFDIARFMQTSPLITAYGSELPNTAQLKRAVANYNADVRQGFIQPAIVTVASQPVQFGWVSANSFDAGVNALRGGTTSSGGNFVPVGSDGIIRAQLIWETFADLDLHLLLPDNQHVFYANRTVTFNNGAATAMLDHDNLGGVIDAPPNRRIENIAITGTPSNGTYQFYVNSFSSPNPSDFFTLTVRSGTQVQSISGNLNQGQNSQTLTVNFPGR
ncbi:hypothetical protein BH20VER1_BH20VER1_03480 [soil metagenome]